MTGLDRARVAQLMRHPVTFAGHEQVEETVLTDGADFSCHRVRALAHAGSERTGRRVAVSDEVH